MTVDYKNVSLKSQCVMVKKNNLSCALNLTEDSLDKIYSLTACTRGGECEITGEELTYGGTVNFNAVFSAEEINRVEVGAKFTFKSPLDAEFDHASAKYSVQDVAVKNDGGMLYCVCDLIAEITLEKSVEKSVAVETDALKLTDTFINSLPVYVKKNVTVDDDFSVKRVRRALVSDAHAVVTAVSAGDNVVTVDGEVVLNACFLPFSENSDILKETRLIPFRYELDADGVSADSPASAFALVSGVALKIYVDEESGKASVSAAIGVDISASAYSVREIDYISDAYSPDRELILTRDELEQNSVVSFNGETVRAALKAACKVPEYTRLVKVIGERIEGASYRVDGEDLIIDGVIAGDALFADSDNVYIAEKLVAPFSLELKTSGEIADLGVIAESFNAKIRSGEIECDVTFKVGFAVMSKTTANVVTSIEEGAQKTPNESAISVYVAKKGDTEWDVIKNLGVDGEIVRKLNPNAEYPLKGGEKLIVFRQKI